MLRLQGRSLRRNADYHRLHEKYRNPEANCPPWLRRLFADNESWRAFVKLRDDAFYYYIEQAALQSRKRRNKSRAVAQLRRLGGKLARLKKRLGRESELADVESQIRNLRWLLKLHRQPPDFSLAQYHWHRAMVTVYESILAVKDARRLSGSLLSSLCKWLSIPEIGLNCTRDTIKAARKRFVMEKRSGRSYLVYTRISRR